ncbi:hypothetical protein AAHH80_40150, partial [Burkholderia pseudomallei]
MRPTLAEPKAARGRAPCAARSSVEWLARPRRALRRSGRIVRDTTHKNKTDDITTPSPAPRPQPSFGPLRWIV